MTEPTISVGILTAERISFDFYGDFTSYGFENTFSGRYTAYLEDEIIIIEGRNQNYKISEEISFDPSNIKSESFLIREVVIGVNFHWEQKENQRFLGTFKLIRDGDKITAINVVPVEIYLTSVISSEMSASSSLQMMKAHSIVSRSWLLAQLKKKRQPTNSFFQNDDGYVRWYDKEEHTKFDVCADDHCQRYHGITKAFTDVVKKAIDETRGIVLYYEDKICDTRYSKCCGGITEAFENVWEPVKHKYLSSVVDYKFEPENFKTDFSDETNVERWILSKPSSYCNTRNEKILTQVLRDFDRKTTNFYRWKIEYSQQEISKLINEKTGIDFGDILDLVPVERGNSARLVKLRIVGSKKIQTIGKELEIRRVLSPKHLYSSAFIVKKTNIQNSVPQKFILQGAGWGHGVGLCQIGAAVMGEMGYQFDEILTHYFDGAKIKKIY